MSITISLDAWRCRPGSLLSGRVALTPLAEDAERKVELSVLWETEGKGDTDRGVLLHRVLSDGDPVAGSAEHAFEVKLPLLPVSYAGTLIKVRWLVRVRRVFTLADDLLEEAEFHVGPDA